MSFTRIFIQLWKVIIGLGNIKGYVIKCSRFDEILPRLLGAVPLWFISGVEELVSIVNFNTFVVILQKSSFVNNCFWLISLQQTRLCYNQFFKITRFKQRFDLCNFHFQLTVEFLMCSWIKSPFQLFIFCMEVFYICFEIVIFRSDLSSFLLHRCLQHNE